MNRDMDVKVFQVLGGGKGHAVIGPRTVKLVFSVMMGEAGRSPNRVIRLPVEVREVGTGSVRHVEAIGLVEGSWAYPAVEVEVPLGEYLITTPEAPDRPWRFRLVEGEPSPVQLCPHSRDAPSEVHALGSLIRDGKNWLSDGTYLLQRCCGGLERKRKNVYALSVTQPLAGPLRVTGGGQEYTVRKGEYFVVNPQDLTKLPAEQAWPLHFRTVLIDQPGLRALRDLLGLSQELGPFDFAPGPRPLVGGVATALDLRERVGTAPVDLGQEEATEAAFRQLVIQLLHEHPNRLLRAWKTHAAGLTKEVRLRRAVEYVHGHYAQLLTVGSVAKEIGVGERWLHQRFQAVFRQTPMAYVRHLRVRRAMELLKDPALTVEEVAHRVGYTSVPAFRKAFISHAKTPPALFRAHPPSS